MFPVKGRNVLVTLSFEIQDAEGYRASTVYGEYIGQIDQTFRVGSFTTNKDKVLAFTYIELPNAFKLENRVVNGVYYAGNADHLEY